MRTETKLDAGEGMNLFSHSFKPGLNHTELNLKASIGLFNTASIYYRYLKM